MASLKRNLEWLFLVIVVIGTGLLAWGLYSRWIDILDRHHIRQNSQITTIGSATRAVLSSQETLLTLVGAQLMVHWHMGQAEAVESVLDTMLEINPTARGSALLDSSQTPIAVRWRMEQPQPETEPPNRPAGPEACAVARSAQVMIVGRSYRHEASDRWLVPVCKAMRNASGEVTGFVSAALALEGPNSLLAEQAALGRTNIVQVIREADLSSLLWVTALDLPEGYLAQPIARETYDKAIDSAKRLSGQSFEAIRSSGRPYPYYIETALGPQVGMALYDTRYGLWVLTQTNRRELRAEFLSSAWIYVAIYFVVIFGILALLFAIGRAERRRRADLVHQANHDMLTGLPNRQSMVDEFERMRRKHGNEFALMFVDMDNFKAINDGFGHMEGDTVLKLVGERLGRFANQHERVARVGGDEFVVLTPETAPRKLLGRGEALAACLTERYLVDGARFELGCSIGIARVLDAGHSLNDLLRAADVAMYSAKQHHNPARLFEPTMGRVYLENIQIEQKLRAAIDEGAIHMVYQPQVDGDGKILGVEALARWTDPELGEVGPSRFIAIAETSGLIRKLGEYILECCLEDAARIDRHRDVPLRFSINISVRQFLQARFAAHVVGRVSEANLSSVVPVLEITENLFADDYGSVAAELASLRESGIRIALDDFGTGYSSLALLRSLTIDELKIDKSFVDDLEAVEGTRKLVQSVVAIGRNYDVRVIVEGVETPRQFEILREDGCDVFQGFHFWKPMPLDQLIELITERG